MINRFMQFKEKNTWMLRSFIDEDWTTEWSELYWVYCPFFRRCI